MSDSVPVPAGLDPDDLIDDVAVVILAAGSGERLGASRPKAFVGLAGSIVLAHAIAPFEAHPAVDSIVLVVPPDWDGPTEVLVDDLGCAKVSSIELGGATRAESLAAGLAAVADRRATAVLVHDAARPLVSEALIDRVLAPLAEGHDAVVPALAVIDTIKRVDHGGLVVDTPPRAELRAAQTPQACRASSLHAAIAALTRAGRLGEVTDDAHAIELHGGRVVVVEGDVATRKITTVDDLRAVEAILAPPPGPAPLSEDAQEDPEDLEPLDDEDLAGAGDEPTGDVHDLPREEVAGDAHAGAASGAPAPLAWLPAGHPLAPADADGDADGGGTT